MFSGIPGGKLSEHKKDLRDLTMQGRQRDDSGSKYNELKIIEERAWIIMSQERWRRRLIQRQNM